MKLKFLDTIDCLQSMEIFSIEMNVRLSQEMDSLMSMMHYQINRATSSAISDIIIAEISQVRPFVIKILVKRQMALTLTLIHDYHAVVTFCSVNSSSGV